MFQAVICAALVVGALAAPHKIVNGTDADPGEFPFVISLRGSGKSHSCGGSIINENWVMTAAHCVSGSLPASQSVQYGTNDISSDGNFTVGVKRIIIHESYDPWNSYKNDIALLELDRPITFTSTVQPVVFLAQEELTTNGAPAVLIGWGLNASSGSIQRKLQKVDIFIVTYQDCDAVHSNTVHESHICAGIPSGGKGQCSGDSGGPLLVNNIQVGIVSWSVKPCTIAPYPGVFTQVSYFSDWIKKHTTPQSNVD